MFGIVWPEVVEIAKDATDAEARIMWTAIKLAVRMARVLALPLLLATCRDNRFRDGPEAVRLATQACELTDWKNPWYLGTLAAAYAQMWDFEPALKWQRAALADEQYAQREDVNARQRIALYEAHEEYIEP